MGGSAHKARLVNIALDEQPDEIHQLPTYWSHLSDEAFMASWIACVLSALEESDEPATLGAVASTLLYVKSRYRAVIAARR
jgi:hypothetical protein